MTQVLVLASLFGAGAILLLTAQPVGASRPSLARRLAALSPEPTHERTRAAEPVFHTRLFEESLRPLLERAGAAVFRLLGRLGLDLRVTDERLRAAGDRGGLALFEGQKLAGAIVGFSFLPAAESFELAPLTPVWLWLVAAAAGFFLPDAMLKRRAETRRRRMREDLVHFAELVSLAVSAGLGVEGALDQAAFSGEGPLFEELQRLLREGRLRGTSASATMARLPEEVGFVDAEPLAAAIQAAADHGTAVTQALRAQARALRDRRRLELVEAAERAQVRMLLPVGLLILPAFFVVVLYPAAVQLLRLTGP
jgi:tight adherence protein C